MDERGAGGGDATNQRELVSGGDYRYEGEIDARILADALAWVHGTERPPQAPLEPLEWPKIGGQTLAAYRAVLRNGGNGVTA